jgi:hypothetical protein
MKIPATSTTSPQLNFCVFRRKEKNVTSDKRLSRNFSGGFFIARRVCTKRRKAHPEGWAHPELCRRSPNLPHTSACSTIGPTRLNFRVRDGNGCDPRGKLTGKLENSRSRDRSQLNRLGRQLHVLLSCVASKRYNYKACYRMCSRTVDVDSLRRVNSMDKPNGRLVLVSYTCCHASTSSLST